MVARIRQCVRAGQGWADKTDEAPRARFIAIVIAAPLIEVESLGLPFSSGKTGGEGSQNDSLATGCVAIANATTPAWRAWDKVSAQGEKDSIGLSEPEWVDHRDGHPPGPGGPHWAGHTGRRCSHGRSGLVQQT